VLAGGASPEREVSLASGTCVLAALSEAGYLPQLIDPRETDLQAVDWDRFDRCFLALHGGAGEDGRLQRQLDRWGVRYTGSGSAASQAAMSKRQAKERFLRAGVPTPDYVRFAPRETPQQMVGKASRLRFPLVVKPDGGGSSLGIGVVHKAEELPDRVAESRRYSPWVIGEEYVRGREFTAAVMGRRLLPLVEISHKGELFDYRAKYSSVSVRCHFDPELLPIILQRLQAAAVAAARALATSGVVRVDLRLDETGQPWVLEVNTLPGMTERSLVPRAAAAAGLAMPALCDWMLRAA